MLKRHLVGKLLEGPSLGSRTHVRNQVCGSWLQALWQRTGDRKSPGLTGHQSSRMSKAQVPVREPVSQNKADRLLRNNNGVTTGVGRGGADWQTAWLFVDGLLVGRLLTWLVWDRDSLWSSGLPQSSQSSGLSFPHPWVMNNDFHQILYPQCPVLLLSAVGVINGIDTLLPLNHLWISGHCWLISYCSFTLVLDFIC